MRYQLCIVHTIALRTAFEAKEKRVVICLDPLNGFVPNSMMEDGANNGGGEDDGRWCQASQVFFVARDIFFFMCFFRGFISFFFLAVFFSWISDISC